LDELKITVANSPYPKVAVQWLNQALCFYQSLCLVDSEVLRNRHLRVAAKRQAVKKAPKTQKLPFFTLHKAGTVVLKSFYEHLIFMQLFYTRIF
jgi:hypothetical protein